MTARTARTHDYPELRFVVLSTADEYVVTYNIYDIEGFDGETDAPLFHRKGATSGPDMVDTVEDSEPFISGSVKWDGCSNWNMQDGGHFHECSRAGLARIGAILATCWDMTKTLCPHWDNTITEVAP